MGELKNELKLDSLTFEEALAKLEEIVKRLEDGKLSLDEALALFEEGNILQKFCENQLNNAKLKIEKVLQSTEEQGSLSEKSASTTHKILFEEIKDF